MAGDRRSAPLRHCLSASRVESLAVRPDGVGGHTQRRREGDGRRRQVAGSSGSSVRRRVFVLRQILDAAVADGRIGRNVAHAVRLPPESTRPMRFLDAGQLARVAHAVPSHYDVMCAGWVGLRWGELAGLALDRVDLLRHKVTIDRQLTEVNGRLAFGPPKTSAGVRTVTIPEDLTGILAEHSPPRRCRPLTWHSRR